jgi:hypothetical protein
MPSWWPAPVTAIEGLGFDPVHRGVDVSGEVSARFRTAGQYHRLRVLSGDDLALDLSHAPSSASAPPGGGHL